MQCPRFSSVFHQTWSVSIHYHDWLCCSCVFVQHQQPVSASPATLLMNVNPWDVLVLSAGGDCEEIEWNLCSGVALPVSRGQTVWFIYDTLSIMTLNLISDINVPLVCVMVAFMDRRGFCWFLYAVFYLKRNACWYKCVCVAPAAGPGGDWTSQTGHPSWDELNYSGRNLTPFNFSCYHVGLADYC